MLNDFYDSVNGRALRGIDALQDALLEYTKTLDLALILKEVGILYQQALRNNGDTFTPFFKIEFEEVNNGTHYKIRMEKRIGQFHDTQGTISITYVDNNLRLRNGLTNSCVRNAGWDIKGLRLILGEKIKSFDVTKRGLINGIITEFSMLDKENPTEFAFDLDDDEERLSIIALRNHRHYATSSFYR